MKVKEKCFAGDSFFTAGGKLDVSSTQPLTVAFIGGSLTEGEVDYEGTSLENENLKWANVVIRFLSGLFPLYDSDTECRYKVYAGGNDLL